MFVLRASSSTSTSSQSSLSTPEVALIASDDELLVPSTTIADASSFVVTLAAFGFLDFRPLPRTGYVPSSINET